MKVVVDCRIPGLEEALRVHRQEWNVVAKEGRSISPSDVADADALIVRTRTRCNGSLLAGSKVKLVGTATIGTDHIDIPWCTSHGIKVVSAPGCNAPAVMQYVAASLHAAGFNPETHTLGVVGKGNIGGLVTALYRNAGTKVLVCDPPRAEKGCKDENYISLPDILSQCDAVTFHVPYTKEGRHPTHHLLSETLFNDCMAGRGGEKAPVIVNSSRGPVMQAEIIFSDARFILDTWPFEEYPEDFSNAAIRTLVNNAFIATPHIAGYSVEGKQRATLAMLSALGVSCPGANGIDYPYTISDLRYSLPEVISSFDPIPLSNSLKANPDSFEALRASHLRNEPLPL